MTFTSSSRSQNSPWSSPSADWLRQRDAIVIQSHKKSSLKQLSFSDSLDNKHTKNAIVPMN